MFYITDDHRHTAILLLCLLWPSMALPERADVLPKVNPLRHSNNMIMLEQPSTAILSLDALCTHIYEPWWSKVRDWRIATRVNMLQRPEDYVNSIIPLLFKDFAELDVPVQGIWGNNEDISIIPGWKFELYACTGGCQDIRTTIEWIIIALMEGLPQKRARTKVGLPCPKGYMSKINTVPSRRYYAPPAQESAAYGLLPEKDHHRFITPLLKLNSPEILGDTGRTVTTCECVLMTPGELQKSVERLEDLRERLSQRHAKKRAKGIEPANARERRPKARRGDPVVPPPADPLHRHDYRSTHTTESQSTEARNDPRAEHEGEQGIEAEIDDFADFAFDLEERVDLQDILCYDYDFPELPDTHLEIYPDLHGPQVETQVVPDSPESLAFLQASLSMFANYQGQTSYNFDSASSSGGKPHTGSD